MVGVLKRHRGQVFLQYPVLVLLLLFVCRVANGFPSTILTSTAAKCVHIDVGEELVVTVEYEAPDIAGLSSGGENGKDDRQEFFPGQDMTLLVYQREDESWRWSGDDKTPRTKRKTGTKKVRIQIERQKGDILFYTGNVAGILEICRQSYKATPTNPRRLSLSITKRAATVQEQLKNMAISSSSPQEEIIPDRDQSAGILNAQTSRISIELNRMVDKLHELYSQAEHSKDNEKNFHEKSIRLNGAVRFWPMFRIVVVILAGIVQVMLVVNYMRSKHIY